MPNEFDVEEWSEVIRAVGDTIRTLGGQGALIGGIAVSLRSIPRYTADVDALFWKGEHTAEEILKVIVSQGLQPRATDPIKFAAQTQVFPLTYQTSGVKVDFILASLPFEQEAIERSESMSVAGYEIRVLSAEDLVIMKLVAGRPSDIGDVTSLLMAHPKLDMKYVTRHVQQIASIVEDPSILDRLAKLVP